MSFRSYFAGVIFIVLLIWGPIDHSWPAWIVIRIAYVVAVPISVWLLLGLLLNHGRTNNKVESTLGRMLSGAICISLLVLAVLEALSETHIGNTQWIKTRDGMEAVGDDIVRSGPDWGIVLLLVILAAIFLWLSVKKGPKTAD